MEDIQIKEILEEYEESGRDIMKICKVLSYTQEIDVIKYFIINPKKLNLGLLDIVYIITNKADEGLIEWAIKRRKEIGLNPADISFIVNRQYDLNLVKKIISRRKEFELTAEEITWIIIETYNSNLAVSYMEQREELGLSVVDCIKIVETCKSTKLIEACILSRDKIGFSLDKFVDSISYISSAGVAREFLENREELNLSKSQIKYLEVIADEQYFENIKLDETKKIKLPSDMKVGIEIECIGEYNNRVMSYIKKYIGKWTSESDGSLESNVGKGIEIKPPALTGDFEKVSLELKMAGEIFKAFGQYTNETCGGHIHIDQGYLTNAQSWRNLTELYFNTEMILYIIANKKGELPRDEIIEYAEPKSKDWLQEIEYGYVSLENEEDIEYLKSQLIQMQGETENLRYSGINFQNLLDDEGKTTIEFRIPNGTIEPDVWIDNINLFGGLVKAAKELYLIQSKPLEERTEKEKQKIEAFENLSNESTTEREKLDLLLLIAIDEEDRHIYEERYEVNCELLRKDTKYNKELRKRVSEKTIKLGKKDIASAVFTGSDRVTGWEYTEAKENYENKEPESIKAKDEE